MTTLDAVNRILSAIGEQAITALNTGGTSIEAEAETYLDQANARIQRRGWSQNRELDITLALPNLSITHGTVTGTFSYGETVTGGTSAATGTFYYTLSNTMFMVLLTGTFQNAETLTGGTSSATATSSAGPSTITTARHVTKSDWITVIPARSVDGTLSETLDFTMLGGYLYDRDDQTYDFTQGVTIDRFVKRTFTNLSEALAEYVVAEASVRYQRFKKRGEGDEAYLRQELLEAKVYAQREDNDLERVNVFQTPEAIRIKGNRSRTFIKSSVI